MRWTASSEAQSVLRRFECLATALKPNTYSGTTWQNTLLKWREGNGAGFGWETVCFSLISASLKGQSLDKKLLGLLVVELTGKPLPERNCYSGNGGYFTGDIVVTAGGTHYRLGVRESGIGESLPTTLGVH